MFYTLASRIPLISTNKSKKFLLIFIVGSLIYILLHYYLYSGKRFEMLDKLKAYYYYVIGIDLLVAYFMTKFNSSDSENSDGNNNEYSRRDREEIERNLRELRTMQPNYAELQRQNALQRQYEQQQLQNKQNNETKSNDEDKSQESPFMTREEIEESEKKENKSNRSGKKLKKPIKEKEKETTSTSVEKSKPQKSKSKKSELEDDTNFPVYGMN